MLFFFKSGIFLKLWFLCFLMFFLTLKRLPKFRGGQDHLNNIGGLERYLDPKLWSEMGAGLFNGPIIGGHW